MEPQTALVGADGAVELDAVAVVHLNLALVVHPGNTEHDDPLGGDQTLQEGVLAVQVFIFFDDHAQGFQNFGDGLQEFRLVRVLSGDPLQDFVYIAHRQLFSSHGLSATHCSRLRVEMQPVFAI